MPLFIYLFFISSFTISGVQKKMNIGYGYCLLNLRLLEILFYTLYSREENN